MREERRSPTCIPTEFAGVKFRSRLEARWAVYFDDLCLEWRFEPEGYQLKSGWYVPDFFLPEVGESGVFIEVKPEAFLDELPDLHELFDVSGHPSFVATGPPHRGHGQEREDLYRNDWGWDLCYRFCHCPKCHKIGIEYEGRGDRVCALTCFPDSDGGETGEHPRFRHASDKAWAYRFW